MKAYVAAQIRSSSELKAAICCNDELLETICRFAGMAIAVYRAGNKVMVAGNGGSAADAQHIAGELVGTFSFDRDPLPALALTTDTSILTAVGNDYGFDQVFARQIQANGVTGDLFLAISTSGNSPNLLRALEVCRGKGITTAGLTGTSGGLMAQLCDCCIRVPSKETPRIQEAHIMIGHIFCAIVEETLFGKGKGF